MLGRLKGISFFILFLFIFSAEVLAQDVPAPSSAPGPVTTSPSLLPQPAPPTSTPLPQIAPPEVKTGPGEVQAQPEVAQPREVQPQIPPSPLEELSEFEQYVSKKRPLEISTDIKQFGYDLFRQPPSTFAPVERVPVGPEYVIGPGDEIRITVWGKIDGQWSVVVDRDGKISIPKIGVLGVSGLTFQELKELLYKEFSKYYTGFEMNISMGQLRTIRVYVVGNARRPGAYTVSSLSTLVNALFEAGGPSKTGTMRDIQVKRNGKTIVHFDMYDLLLKGDKTKDIRLMPEDVVFIPQVGPLVGIAGSVKRPAIYELKEETTLFQLVEMSGGLSDIAFLKRVQIERVYNGTEVKVFEGYIDDLRDFRLQAGDVIKIFPVHEDKRYVRISGAVQRPGEYGFKEGLRVKDLLELAGGLKYFAYPEEAEVTRIHIKEKGPETERIIINLNKALEGDTNHNILLKENDYLFVRTIPEWELYRTVTITGEVRFPGTYTIKKGERLSSLIERAGGFTERAYLRGAIFTRQSVQKLQQRQIEEMVDRLERELLSVSSAAIATASSGEEATLFQRETEQKRQFIQRLRQVKAMGRMVVTLDMPERLKNTIYDIELEDGDSLHIPERPNVITVLGSVYNQTAFIYDPDKDPFDYIDLAGGYTEGADRSNVYILKTDGSAVKPSKGLFGLFSFTKLDPGDTIIVPEKLERIAWMRNIKDITQILYQIAVTAGVIIVAF